MNVRRATASADAGSGKRQRERPRRSLQETASSRSYRFQRFSHTGSGSDGAPGASCLEETIDWVSSTGSTFAGGFLLSLVLSAAVTRLICGSSKSTISEDVFSTSNETNAIASRRLTA